MLPIVPPPMSYLLSFNSEDDCHVIYMRYNVIADFLLKINGDKGLALKIGVYKDIITETIYEEGVIDFRIFQIDDITVEDKL